MSHTIQDKPKLMARVRRIQGQAAALEKQLQNETDCGAILQQIAAIRGAVNGLLGAVIEGHITHHLVLEPDEAQRRDDLDVVLQVIRSYVK
ncbi:metal/formaldehyde-sensitive transcriptional repressor [Amantichitinum ursilacus]|uniref:Transcriptional repressor RcnR n=1 Tax=Amantichitinum ursilacus TaxID=857265 RepID=A0A0N0GLA6_9NEIS|nr:metal/formaldehyde-sensitive transcriptional repressor [Amantichitinum ursilacus]KPC49655.1 Transcriptional repressor RcnR [Amantichitinum ursilacus]